MGFDSSKSELSTRGGFTPATINMDTLGRSLSHEYNDYQQYLFLNDLIQQIMTQ